MKIFTARFVKWYYINLYVQIRDYMNVELIIGLANWLSDKFIK